MNSIFVHPCLHSLVTDVVGKLPFYETMKYLNTLKCDSVVYFGMKGGGVDMQKNE